MKPRVLLVDDDREVLLVTGQLLERSNFEVVSVTSAADALNRIGAEAFDLVITDYRMSGSNGDVVVNAARATQPATPVMMITGWIDELPRWLRSGPAAVRVVPKPFTLGDLLAVAFQVMAANTNVSAAR